MLCTRLGKGLKSLRASRKNGNRQLQEVGGWRDSPECTRDLGHERLRGTLDEMTCNAEKELVEPNSSRKTGHHMRDGAAIPQFKFWPIIVPV